MTVTDMSLSVSPVLETLLTDRAFEQEVKVMCSQVKAQLLVAILVSFYTEVTAPLVSSSLAVVVDCP